MDAFATVEQLEAGWHALLGDERVRAGVLLERASRIIRSDCPRWAVYEAREPGICADICCEMVRKAMLSGIGDVPEGVTQMNTTTGPFTDGYTFANPTGDLYLSDAQKRRLGVGGSGRAFTVAMTGGG